MKKELGSIISIGQKEKGNKHWSITDRGVTLKIEMHPCPSQFQSQSFSGLKTIPIIFICQIEGTNMSRSYRNPRQSQKIACCE